MIPRSPRKAKSLDRQTRAARFGLIPNESLEAITASLSYHVQARGRSVHTERHYRRAFERFFKWLEPQGVLLSQAKQADVERYMGHLREQPRMSPATLCWYFAGLQAFYKWHAERHGYKNPMEAMVAPVVPETPKAIVDIPDLKIIVSSLERRRRLRDATLVALLAETGMRISEALALNWDDIDWKDQTVRILKTKNRDIREVPLTGGTMERMDKLRARSEHPYIFAGKGGERFTVSGAEQMFRKIFSEHGLEGITPHKLRHTFATHFMDANPHGQEILKVIGGWKSDTMVARYSKKGREARAQDAFRAAAPIRL